MTTSTHKDMTAPQNGAQTSGALADALTLVRVVLTPLIMFIIVKAWSAKPDDPMGFVSLDLRLVLLASILFVIAAITDVLDDYIGGDGQEKRRFLGWFDDIADSVLIGGTLLALLWVTYQAGLLHWSFAVPAFTLIGRDLVIGIFKGANLSKFGFLETKLGDMKSALAMFGGCILVASPWLSNFFDGLRAGGSAETALNVYNNASPLIWNIGLAALWVAAVLSLVTGFKLLTTKTPKGDVQA